MKARCRKPPLASWFQAGDGGGENLAKTARSKPVPKSSRVSNSKTESKSRPKPNPPLDSRRHPKSPIAVNLRISSMRRCISASSSSADRISVRPGSGKSPIHSRARPAAASCWREGFFRLIRRPQAADSFVWDYAWHIHSRGGSGDLPIGGVDDSAKGGTASPWPLRRSWISIGSPKRSSDSK